MPPVMTPTIPPELELPFNDFDPNTMANVAEGMAKIPGKPGTGEREINKKARPSIPGIIEILPCFLCLEVISPSLYFFKTF